MVLAVDENVLQTIQEVADKAKKTGVDVGLIFIPIAITYRRQSNNSKSLLLFSAIDKQQFVASVGRGIKNIRFAIDAAEILSLKMDYKEGESMKTQAEMIATAKKEAAKILLLGSEEIAQELNLYTEQNRLPEKENFFKNDRSHSVTETKSHVSPRR